MPVSKTLLPSLAAALLLAAPLTLGDAPAAGPFPCEGPLGAPVHEYGPGRGARPIDRCLPPDGHAEYGLGLAVFLAHATDAAACWGASADHAPYPTIVVDDAFFGSIVHFTIATDAVDVTGVLPCGDGHLETTLSCIGTCTLPIPPGLDGAYWVLIDGSSGTAST